MVVNREVEKEGEERTGSLIALRPAMNLGKVGGLISIVLVMYPFRRKFCKYVEYSHVGLLGESFQN